MKHISALLLKTIEWIKVAPKALELVKENEGLKGQVAYLRNYCATYLGRMPGNNTTISGIQKIFAEVAEHCRPAGIGMHIIVQIGNRNDSRVTVQVVDLSKIPQTMG